MRNKILTIVGIATAVAGIVGLICAITVKKSKSWEV